MLKILVEILRLLSDKRSVGSWGFSNGLGCIVDHNIQFIKARLYSSAELKDRVFIFEIHSIHQKSMLPCVKVLYF